MAGARHEEDTAHVDHAGRDQSTLIGAAVLGVSPYSAELHAQTMVRDDQMFLNPQNYAFYDRAVQGDDIDGFLTGSGRIDTTNDIQTQSFGIRIPYMLEKDYLQAVEEKRKPSNKLVIFFATSSRLPWRSS